MLERTSGCKLQSNPIVPEACHTVTHELDKAAAARATLLGDLESELLEALSDATLMLVSEGSEMTSLETICKKANCLPGIFVPNLHPDFFD